MEPGVRIRKTSVSKRTAGDIEVSVLWRRP